jgi:ubiquinone biosynthesis protein
VDGGETPAESLRRALESLGPIYASFGRYLASRADLLRPADRLELESIADAAPATSEELARQVIEEQTGLSLTEAFDTFEPRPFDSRLLFQWHRAQLSDGRAVVVKLAHPDLTDSLEPDLDLVGRLQPALTRIGISQRQAEEAIDDFRVMLQAEIDLERETKALEELRRYGDELSPLVVPQVHRRLSAARVLTRERLDGWTVGEFARGFEETGSNGAGGPGDEKPGRDGLAKIAGRICQVWLRQALVHQPFPVTPAGRNLLLLPNFQVAFTGGAFGRIPQRSKENLRQYLYHSGEHDPDGAYSFLTEELNGGSAGVDPALRNRFRQAAPYREGGGGEDGDKLSEFLFLHWRLASESGLQPRAELVHFFRGLSSITTEARRLAPDQDSLAVGLREFRLRAGLDELRELMSPRAARINFGLSVEAMLGLPRKLDEVLSQFAEGRSRMRVEIAESGDKSRQKNRAAAILALLLVLVTMILLSKVLAGSGLGGDWTERIAAILVAAIGSYVIGACLRS